MMNTVVAIGEVLWDLLPDGPVLGGAPLNFTYRCNSLGHAGIIVSRLGQDDLGRRACHRLEELGLNTQFIQWDSERPTGTVPVRLDAAGVPQFTILPDVAYDHLELSEDLLPVCLQAACIYYGTLIQRTAPARQLVQEILNAGGEAIRFLDLNLRQDCFTPESIQLSLEAADILKLNEDEARHLAELFRWSAHSLPDLARRIVERWQLSHCLLTLGERGALAAAASGEIAYSPGYRVRVIDTIGAGDAFSAGFLDALLRQKPLEESCQFGNALGALVAMQKGGTTPMRAHAITQFLDTPSRRIIDHSLEPYAI